MASLFLTLNMASRSSEPGPADGGTVLVVDDDKDIVDGVQRLIEAELPGVRVLKALGGPAALETMRRERVDLLVTDFKMPGMNGDQLIEAVTALAPGMPCIVITAFGAEATRRLGRARLDGLVRKPIDPDALVDRVRELLRRRG